MQQHVPAPAQFVTLVEKIDQSLDAVVDHGSDDELFIASYLQGHFAVEARKLELDSTANLTQLASNMQHSLDQAFSNNELEKADQQAVFTLWQKLLASCVDEA
ncbi:YfcL family protein [Alteromonas gilva]|uniref:YfcL family protein n=1 Tax=Alteromonas gilva TaxID=2987522 RepID=A0ABT5L2K4_9ALTE|nr:YfcL family protein [Alteromonas gilva]MDC8830631.1 YfcL family protein [Alteromonas gilva]